MKLEKQRVSALKGVIARMKNGVYDNQEDLMKAVIEILCSKGDSAKSQFKYHFNHFDFSEDKAITPEIIAETVDMQKNIEDRQKVSFKTM